MDITYRELVEERESIKHLLPNSIYSPHLIPFLGHSTITSMVASAGFRFRAALAQERPLQVAGCINAYSARLAESAGFRAIYLSGAGWRLRRWEYPIWVFPRSMMC